MADDGDDNVTHLKFPKPPARPFPEPKPREIPVLPSLGVDPADIAATSPDMRAVACVNMRLAGAPFHEIAKALEYKNAAMAKTAYIRALASTHPPEDWETLRQTEVMRAEQLMRRSFTMAAADYFVDMNDPTKKIPNTQKLQWHEQAGKDLALHAMISGAKAPTRLELMPSEVELNQMVNALLQAQGELPEIEGEVIDFEDIPPEAEASTG
jgi:hypothetical protein